MCLLLDQRAQLSAVAVLVLCQRHCWLQHRRGIPCSDITAQPFLAEESPLSSCRGEMCVQGCRARPKALRGLEEHSGAHWPLLVSPNAKGKVNPYGVWTQIWVSPPPQVSGVHTPAGWWILSSPTSPAPTPHSLGRTFSSRAAE